MNLKMLLSLFLFISSLVFCSAPALASFASSEFWFNKFSVQVREDIQSHLILLGHYEGLVDGDFGPITFNSLVKFEMTYKNYSDGILKRMDLERLETEANEVRIQLKFKTVNEDKAGLSIILPLALFVSVYETEWGKSFATESGDIILRTLSGSNGDRTFRKFFDDLNQSSISRKIDSSTFKQNWFTISGKNDSENFYLKYYNTADRNIGYRLTWAKSQSKLGRILSSYLASWSTPLGETDISEPKSAPPLSTTTKLPKVTSAPLPPILPSPPKPELKLEILADENFGPFISFVEFPRMLALNGEISANTPLDFRRALKARPNLRTLVLNSGGGLVSAGLLIAQDAKKANLNTTVLPSHNCFSACSFIFFAGKIRILDGQLGVHQMSSENPDLGSAQISISNIFDTLRDFDVHPNVISIMLRTSSEDIHIFTAAEIEAYSIERK